MENVFHLEIFTPERQFFVGDVEAVSVLAFDGELTVLANHAAMVAPLAVGSIRIRQGDTVTEVFNSEGFMEVRPEGTVIFSQVCEYPEEIDVNRAEEALHRAEEALRQKRSMREYRQSKIALARAKARRKTGHK